MHVINTHSMREYPLPSSQCDVEDENMCEEVSEGMREMFHFICHSPEEEETRCGEEYFLCLQH